jgi:hypothetical protein
VIERSKTASITAAASWRRDVAENDRQNNALSFATTRSLMPSDLPVVSKMSTILEVPIPMRSTYTFMTEAANIGGNRALRKPSKVSAEDRFLRALRLRAKQLPLCQIAA